MNIKVGFTIQAVAFPYDLWYDFIQANNLESVPSCCKFIQKITLLLTVEQRVLILHAIVEVVCKVLSYLGIHQHPRVTRFS